ncbi:MAG: hypothetical protein RML45_09195 [Acetobacteraceae bacterium]|nr:hypothetical protein [Acetobacteraceae bacterium]
MAREFIALFSQKEGEALIRRHCRQVGLEVADLKRLVEEVIEKDSMGRRHGLRQTFDDILDNSGSDGIPAP